MIPLLLAGPAGSGKTYRCLAEIADHLRASPVGAPLILVAPRQATYQLERQILSFDGVNGFTRLSILSFQRLAQFVFDATGTVPPKLLNEEGRIMALRAILGRRRESLRVYKASAQREGLAQELSTLWREVCEHRSGPGALRAAANNLDKNPRLRAKLADFADIFEDYQAWLKKHNLRDADELLDLAADATLKGPLPEIAGLWLDGFAQMTPQERRLLNALLPKCNEATLALCLPQRPLPPDDELSMWSTVARTYCQVRAELQTIFNAPPREETLPRRQTNGRFDESAALAHLEERWSNPRAFEADCKQVRIIKCANSEAEAIFTAREILKFVRTGGRFREAAVLVRSMEDAHEPLRRVFHRYGIPFFLDRREAVAHHPLAELTRGALRTIAFGYKHYDLFGALKSGLIGIVEDEIDWFENMSLARGWNGDDWHHKLPCGPKATHADIERVEEIRKGALQSIFRLDRQLGDAPSGTEFSESLREFWATLKVEEQLDAWASDIEGSLHSTVWTQMSEWLDSLQLAFGDERMSLARWLEIVEAGLAALTVGLIPPSLDQVLIGAVDRSRNPDLRAVFLVGVNEGLFPKISKEPLLLNDTERDALDEAGVHLGTTTLWNLGAEQFYGYVACTRARSSLTVTYSEAGTDGEPLNPSIFISHLKRLFPTLEEEAFARVNPFEAEAAHELNTLIFAAARRNALSPFENELLKWPTLSSTWNRARAGITTELPRLTAAQVTALYGDRLRTSVSKLEQFAACPFRFYVASGLHAEERLLFELDHREQGSFQHEVLAKFHARVQAMDKRWRDISGAEGRRLIAEIGGELKSQFQEGLANSNAANRFRAEAKLAALQDFIEAYLELMRGCEFDPKHVELGFGGDGPLPGWEVQVDEGRSVELMGRIDRVDVWIDEEAKCCYALVYDYKSSDKKLHRVLVQNAIQQQLPAYLAALQNAGGTREFPLEVRAAGAFYVNLRVRVSSAKSRSDALDPEKNNANFDLKQAGVFDWGLIDKLDVQRSGQLFDYKEKDGEPKSAVNLKGLAPDEFAALLGETGVRLRNLGRRIFDGEIGMAPYQFNRERACGNCFYAGICRIDPWTHVFRELEVET
ncbi:MAG TPA: PD-(D/E)XK nuclease family protein [Verrucomicrobiae bacterium]